MTSCQVVYDAFLARILEDDWPHWALEDAQADWKQLLMAAIPWFKFPRKSLKIITDEEGQDWFEGDLGAAEISILANFMKCEWLNRSIMTWENVKPLYEERDFSQANLLSKLKDILTEERMNALYHESVYYRSREGKPFEFSKLASHK